MSGITDSEWKYAIKWALEKAEDHLPSAKKRAEAIRIIKDRCSHAGCCGPDTPWVNGTQRGLDVRSRDRSRQTLITWGEVADCVGEPQQLTLFELQLEVQA